MTLLLNRGEQGGLPSNSRLTVRKRWLLLEVAIHGEISTAMLVAKSMRLK